MVFIRNVTGFVSNIISEFYRGPLIGDNLTREEHRSVPQLLQLGTMFQEHMLLSQQLAVL